MSTDVKWEGSKECDLQSIVDRFTAIDNNNDRIDYIKNVIDDCVVCPTVPIHQTKSEPTKRKRKLSGWNCYLRWCSKKTDKSFPECMKDADLKNVVYKQNKPQWNEYASEGCDVSTINVSYPRQTNIEEF